MTGRPRAASNPAPGGPTRTPDRVPRGGSAGSSSGSLSWWIVTSSQTTTHAAGRAGDDRTGVADLHGPTEDDRPAAAGERPEVPPACGRLLPPAVGPVPPSGASGRGRRARAVRGLPLHLAGRPR